MLSALHVQVETMREHILFRKNALFVEVLTILQENSFKRIRKDKEKALAADYLEKRWTEQTPRKCFRYRSEDHLITKF